jgi:hypothetical protein
MCREWRRIAASFERRECGRQNEKRPDAQRSPPRQTHAQSPQRNEKRPDAQRSPPRQTHARRLRNHDQIRRAAHNNAKQINKQSKKKEIRASASKVIISCNLRR